MRADTKAARILRSGYLNSLPKRKVSSKASMPDGVIDTNSKFDRETIEELLEVIVDFVYEFRHLKEDLKDFKWFQFWRLADLIKLVVSYVKKVETVINDES